MAVLQEMISGVVRDGNITKPFINLCIHLLLRERVLQAAKPSFFWELTMDQRLVPLIPAMCRRSQSELVPSIQASWSSATTKGPLVSLSRRCPKTAGNPFGSGLDLIFAHWPDGKIAEEKKEEAAPAPAEERKEEAVAPAEETKEEPAAPADGKKEEAAPVPAEEWTEEAAPAPAEEKKEEAAALAAEKKEDAAAPAEKKE